MSMHIESVVATRDMHPRGSDAVAHSVAAAAAAVASAVPAAAAWPVAAASAPPDASLAQELAAVKHRITCVEGEISATEAAIVVSKTAREACPAGSETRREHTTELQRLGRKEDRLRDEKALLFKKEEQLRDGLKRKELALDQPSAGQYSVA